MAIKHSESQYELLNGKRRRDEQKPFEQLIELGLAVLLLFVVVLMFYLSFMNFEDTNDENTPLDFVQFGPLKYKNSDIEYYRARVFSIAAKSNYKTNWTAKYKINLKTRVEKNYNLACYYRIPSSNTSDDLLPGQINASLCTFLIIAFAQVKNNSVYFPSSFETDILRQTVKIRERNPQLKILLSIMHFSNGSHTDEGFPGVVANKENINKFVSNVGSVVRKFDLNGIDIDWEFPSWPLLNLEEKYGFSKLLEALRNHLPDSILTAAVAAPLNIIDSSYEIYSLARFLDFINVMAYDYYSYQWYFPITGPNSPLFSSKNESGYFQNLNVNVTIQYWIAKGMPKEKILLGMPTYGHSFKLINKNNHGFYAPASGLSIGSNGFASFPEICQFISQQKTNTIFDHDTRTPYSFYKKDWISYDNEISLAYKAEFAASLGLGGAMVFSLNTDDYRGSSLCSSSVFPLTSRIKLVLNDDYL